MNKLMHQASTWTVQLYRLHRVVTPSGQSMLTTYDDVLFKSNNNLFISMKDNLQCVTGEEAHP